MIWDAAKAGNKALLQQYLVGASARDLIFEKADDNVSILWKAFEANQCCEPSQFHCLLYDFER
jgi:hypothetical protein